ncbi:MAG: extensin family protein [Kofleriaceae bacterium]
MPSPTTKAATELWALVCGAADAALFNVMLTPNFNAEHRNHLHLELTPDAGWMMVH